MHFFSTFPNVVITLSPLFILGEKTHKECFFISYNLLLVLLPLHFQTSACGLWWNGPPPSSLWLRHRRWFWFMTCHLSIKIVWWAITYISVLIHEKKKRRLFSHPPFDSPRRAHAKPSGSQRVRNKRETKGAGSGSETSRNCILTTAVFWCVCQTSTRDNTILTVNANPFD